jgi:hypothetical protein
MKKYIFVLFVLSVFFISGCAQLNRDNLRYSAVKRGYEVYRIDGKDSLQSATENNERAIKLYEDYVRIVKTTGLNEKFDDIRERIENYIKDLESSCNLSDIKQKIGEFKNRLTEIDKEFNKELEMRDDRQMELAKQTLYSLEKELKGLKEDCTKKKKNSMGGDQRLYRDYASSKYPLGSISTHRISDIEIIWPKELLEKVELDSKSTEELIRALSSTASVAQMRDLLTEPSLPPLLPVERHVELGCLPPPDSAVFESTANILATLKGLKIEGQAVEPTVSADFASHVVKLFEETERTVFLQYALFRLCEMSVNSPAEFRNVYPVIIHDIVRRTAEMSQLVNIEREKSRQEELRLEILKLEAPDRDKLYRMCIKAKLGAGILDVEKIIEECKKLKAE